MGKIGRGNGMILMVRRARRECHGRTGVEGKTRQGKSGKVDRGQQRI